MGRAAIRHNRYVPHHPCFIPSDYIRHDLHHVTDNKQIIIDSIDATHHRVLESLDYSILYKMNCSFHVVELSSTTGVCTMKLIAYYRVSTRKQGDSGLGLEAQQQAVANYAKAVDGEIMAEFKEVESGKVRNRPQLQSALAACRKEGGTLVVAKLDRLSRNVAFTAALKDSGLDFVCCDNPNATRLTIDILAAVAADEARRISERTKAALAALKVRGVKLGSPKAADLAPLAGRQNAAKAAAYLTDIRPLAERKRAAGWTYEQIAHYLTGKGILTRRGKAWSNVTVRRILEAA
jgi:DNA invertase Pin-like site-specific DNA recombinase